MFWAEYWDLLDVWRTGGRARHEELLQDEGGHLADAGHREVTPYTVVRAWGARSRWRGQDCYSGAVLNCYRSGRKQRVGKYENRQVGR